MIRTVNPLPATRGTDHAQLFWQTRLTIGSKYTGHLKNCFAELALDRLAPFALRLIAHLPLHPHIEARRGRGVESVGGAGFGAGRDPLLAAERDHRHVVVAKMQGLIIVDVVGASDTTRENDTGTGR